MSVRILIGDCRERLRTLPSKSVHCIVTSPPYFGLRDYGVEGQLGLEATPSEFVSAMVEVFREARRVLRDDGTFWLNLGNSYAAGRGGTSMPAETLAGGKSGKGNDTAHRGRLAQVPNGKNPNAPIATYQPHRNAGAIGLKRKDLIGIPWRVAFALQEDGWYLRQDIIWSKPNPMPESVQDRCTKAHEYLFLLSKSERYHYDAAAIAEAVAPSTVERLSQPNIDAQAGSDRVPGKTNGAMKAVSPRFGGNKYGDDETEQSRTKSGNAYEIKDGKRNKRSVWTVATQPFKEAHFATFPPALIEPCVLAGCPAGGTVLDPFGGAGTTGLVADRLGRDAILIELNPAYAAMAAERIKREQPMFASVTTEAA